MTTPGIARWGVGVAAAALAVTASWAPLSAAPATETDAPVTIEWRANGETISRTGSGPLGVTGVTVELRSTATPHGRRYDVRLRNRTTTAVAHTALAVKLPRVGTGATAVIEGGEVAVPAEVHQWWEPARLLGVQYGFAYAISSGGATVKRVGPSTRASQWGGRASGIVRIDGRAYVVPEFWQRQPRRITITPTDVVLTLYEGKEPLRAGEDAWDRFAILDGALSDGAAVGETEALPALTDVRREELRQRFGIAPEGLHNADATVDAWLRKYDRWQGTSWEKKYADSSPPRDWEGEEQSTRTTLFSLFRRGAYTPVNQVGAYTWRSYGDIQWAAGMSAGHYDWVRSAFRHYLRTGNPDALAWGMAAMRHAVTVDYVWTDTHTRGDAGLARYEKGEHGGKDYPPKPSHVWVEGLFMAAEITGDPWVREAAVRRVEGVWNFFRGRTPYTWSGAYGELRWITWPLWVLVRGFAETNDLRYWTKANEIVGEVLRSETLSGGAGYIKNYAWATDGHLGNPNAAWVLQHGYAVPALLLFADVAKARGESTDELEKLLERMGAWLTTPMPNGPYVPPGSRGQHGAFVMDGWCPPADGSCLQPGEPSIGKPTPSANMLMRDLFAWLAMRDPVRWKDAAQAIFRDSVMVSVHPNGTVGFLTDQYPGTETKAMGWQQLFGDRAARWLGATPSPAAAR